MICPWFGDPPSWEAQYRANIDRLWEHGYDFLFDTDLEGFRRRVERVLDVRCPITPGSSKIHDYRPAFGELYREEVSRYDYWGHTDYDVVYGRVESFVTDDLLDSCDIQTDNGYDYLCGPWTLYRANPTIASLFREQPLWRDLLEDPVSHGWVETTFTEIAKANARVHVERFHRHKNPELLTLDGDRLLHDGEEISFFHFRYSKQWPPC